MAAVRCARRANCAAAQRRCRERPGGASSIPPRDEKSPRRKSLVHRWEGRWFRVLGPRSAKAKRGQALQLARGGIAATSDDARRRRCREPPNHESCGCPARQKPRRHKSTTMDSGPSSAFSSAYSSAQSSAYSSLANTPRELTQAEALDATKDHRLAPSGRDHLSAVKHGARLPSRYEKRNRELKGRPRGRRPLLKGSGGSGSGSGSSRGSPAGSPLRRHGSVVKFDDSLDQLFEFEDRPPHLDRASWATPQYLPTGVNFINPQGRRRPIDEEASPDAGRTPRSRPGRVQLLHIDPGHMEAELVGDRFLISKLGVATIRGRTGLEELRRMRERQSVRDAKAADEREVEADIVVKTSKVAQHLMTLRSQAKEIAIQEQVDAWHARSPNKRLIGSGLFDVDVLGQNCFGFQDDAPPKSTTWRRRPL